MSKSLEFCKRIVSNKDRSFSPIEIGQMQLKLIQRKFLQTY